MMKIAGIVVLLFSWVSAVAQSQPTTRPTPKPQSSAERERMRREQDARSRNLSMVIDQAKRSEVPQAATIDIEALYRKPTKNELKDLAPIPEDLAKYLTFLEQKRTGLVRLVPDAGCGDSTRLLATAAPCLKHSMPGNGSSYSFRNANYRLTNLSDLRFTDGNIEVAGVNQLAFLVSLGNIGIDQVSVNTKGIEILQSFLPPSDVAEALKLSEKIALGMERDGHFFTQRLRASEGITYALRSVAYRSSFYRSINGITYDEMAFDKRFDITVAFRVVRQHDDGSITVLWKEVARKESPQLGGKKKETGKGIK
jgi:hypothetical protein